MSPRTPRQFEEMRAERRTKILEAALHVFAELGYSAASISMVAKEAGISKGLLYNYFSSKEEVLKTIVLQMFEEAMKELDFDPDMPLTKEKFVDMLNAGIDVTIRNSKRWKLYMALTFQPHVLSVVMEDMMGRVKPFMTQVADYFQRQGHGDPMAHMRLYTAVLDGIQMHYILDPLNFPMEKARKFVIDQFA